MEINTCERYVLAKLEEAQRENEALRDKVQELLDKLAEATKEPSRIEQCVADEGRKLVLERWFYCYADSSAETFEDYCFETACDFYIPNDIGRKEAIREFEPELRHLWEKKLAEREAEKGDAK